MLNYIIVVNTHQLSKKLWPNIDMAFNNKEAVVGALLRCINSVQKINVLSRSLRVHLKKM